MTEADARSWVVERFGEEAAGRCDAIAWLVEVEAGRQNLIAPSTLAHIWARHIADSAQLLTLDALSDGIWLDIGTGAGFPGLVIAALAPERTVVLTEPRRLRAEFLMQAVAALGLDGVTVEQAKVERLSCRAAVISARAVSGVPELLQAAHHCALPDTIWLFPKGRSSADEVASAQRKWHGLFHVEQSITNPDSTIVVARQVRPR